MAKYIKLDDAIEILKSHMLDEDDYGVTVERPSECNQMLDSAVEYISAMPTIEVVRCDDCPHRHMCYREVAVINEVLTTVAYERVDFCSRGGKDNG
jgi:hypothetical protein